MVDTWNVSQVGSFLQSLELPAAVVAAFKDNAVSGADLLALSDGDLRDDLGLTSLQVRKLRQGLAQAEVGAAPAAPRVQQAPAADPAPAAAPLHAQAAPVARPEAAAPKAAAAAAAAPAPAPASRGAGLPEVEAKLAAVTAKIADLEAAQVQDKLQAQRMKLQALERKLADTHLAAQEGQEAAEYTAEKLRSAEGAKWYPGKFMGVTKLQDDKLERRQAEAARAQSVVDRHKAWEAQLQKEVAAQAAVVTPLQAQARELKSLREEESRLRDQLDPQRAVKRTRQRRLQAADLLKGADGELHQAFGILRETHQRAGGVMMVDAIAIGRNRPLTMMAGMNQSRMSQEADAIIKHAAERIVEAKRLAPDLPAVDMASVRSLMGGQMMALVGGVMSELVIRRKLEESMQELQGMMSQVKSALAWLSGQLGIPMGYAMAGALYGEE